MKTHSPYPQEKDSLMKLDCHKWEFTITVLNAIIKVSMETMGAPAKTNVKLDVTLRVIQTWVTLESLLKGFQLVFSNLLELVFPTCSNLCFLQWKPFLKWMLHEHSIQKHIKELPLNNGEMEEMAPENHLLLLLSAFPWASEISLWSQATLRHHLHPPCWGSLYLFRVA